MTTGQLIKAARKTAGMTQEELGKKLGISGSAIAQYETDNRNPKYDTLQRIAVALGVSLDYLLGLRPLPDDLAEVFLNRSIGPNIVALREAANLSQKELSEKTGIPLKYLISFESGTGGYFPTEDDLLRISAVFGIIPEQIKGTGVTQELIREMMKKNKALQEGSTQSGTIIFDVTPDLEQVELKKDAAIVAHVIEKGDLTVKDKDGNVIRQGSGKPWRKLSDAELFRAGILQFHSEEDRIVHFYNQLTNEGRIAAGGCFFQHLDKDALSGVADYVMGLSENPLYQRATAPQSHPSTQVGTDTSPSLDGSERHQDRSDDKK